jgi:hypothetical protein
MMPLATDIHVAMQHRFRCSTQDLPRVDALPPDDTRIEKHRYVCRSCGLYMTGTQVAECEEPSK